MAFLRGLAARGLSGVQLVTSGCHHGLRDAIASVLPGASWQRCRAHYSRNLATRVPKSAQPWVSTLVRTVFEQPDAASVRAQHAQVVTALEAKFPAAAGHLDDARDDILAFTAFPREIWRQVWSNNPGPSKPMTDASHNSIAQRRTRSRQMAEGRSIPRPDYRTCRIERGIGAHLPD